MERILLHICCAPCASYSIEVLKSEGEVTGVFINPNIQPLEEYEKRLETAREVAGKMGIDLIEETYLPESWNRAIQGFEDEPEGGRRCEICFKVRLEKVAGIAAEGGFDSITTTLTISPHKNAGVIHKIGEKAARKHGVKFRKDNFKKKDGFKLSVQRSREWGLYRQNYCGCPMSRRDKK